MKRFIEWILAAIGAGICVGVAILFWLSQASLSGDSLWPLPALVLIETALLGLAGLVAVARDQDNHTLRWGTVTWAACGGLIALTVIGAWSIGTLLLWAVLAFALAGIFSDLRRDRKILSSLGVLAFGAIGNAILLLLLIIAARAGH
jgi:hypothetical protein